MNLSFEQIKAITTGAVRIEKTNEKIQFFRFSKEHVDLYQNKSAEQQRKSGQRCLASAGIKLMFKTDSKTLGMKVEVLKCTTRNYFSFDVFVNGKSVGSLDNFSECSLPVNYTTVELPLGKFSKQFSLGEGTKNVCIYFPWSVLPLLEELTLDDNALIEPIKPKKKLLAYGDSITQGYDALRPSAHYIAQLADKLDAESFNKGIGGDIFFPQLLKTPESFTPDYITVAYGTNDWGIYSEEKFTANCTDFYTTLSHNYPNSKIFAITPIWRKDYDAVRKVGHFNKLEEIIRNAVADLKNVNIIRGFDLVEKSENYYADLRLHPNDAGFKHYIKNLYTQINEMIK